MREFVSYTMKRTIYTISIVFVCTLLVLTMLLCLISNSRVQTALIKVVTQELSRGLQRELTVGKVDYTPFNRLQIDDIYISDSENDTLLYVDTLEANFSLVGFFRQQICFNEVKLKHVTGKIYNTPQGKPNYAFLAAIFNRPKEVNIPHIEVRNVAIDDARIRLGDFYVYDLTTSLSLNHLSMKAIDAEIAALSFIDNQGFILESFTAHLQADSTGARMPRLKLNLPNSTFAAQQLQINYAATSEIAWLPDLNQNVFIKTHVDAAVQANLVPADIARFVPELKNMSKEIVFKGELSGRIDSLIATNLALDYEHHQIIRGNISVIGLPSTNPYLHATLQDLRIDKAFVQDVLSDLQNRPYQLPNNIAQLGVVHYRGEIDGLINSLTLHGAITTRLGTITTDGTLSADSTWTSYNFNGKVATKRFAIGKVLGIKDLGTIGLKTSINITVDTTQTFSARLRADIQHLMYRDYTYRNLYIDGRLHDKHFIGKAKVNDTNIGLRFEGEVDLSSKLPLFDFDLIVTHLRFGSLNLSKKYHDSDLRFALSLHATGNSPDNINGYVQIDTLSFRNKEKELFMDEFKILAETGKHTSLRIQSDYLNANIAGSYTYNTLLHTLQDIIMHYVPKSFNARHREEIHQLCSNNIIDYYIYLNNISLVCDVLELPVTLAGMPTIKGFVNQPNDKFALQVLVPDLRAGKQHFNDLTLNIDNENEQLNFLLYLLKRANNTPVDERLGDLSILLETRALNDSVYLDFNFANDDSIVNRGGLSLQTHFGEYNSRPLVNLEILPSQIILNDTIWHINNSHISYCAADTTLQVDSFRFASSERYIYADGLASTRATDSIRFDLQGIVLDYILDFTNVAQADISFGGEITGWGVVYSLFSNVMFEADVEMLNAKINNATMGDAKATARLNRENKTIDIVGDVIENGDTVAHVDGVVTPTMKRWDLMIDADSTNLEFIGGWTENIFSSISGRGFGNVHVFGIDKQTYVEGKALAKNGELGLGMLGTKYHFSDSVILDVDAIKFENITAYDEEGNPLYINGKLTHDSTFKDLKYTIDLQCKNTMVMNLASNTQDIFYGKIYASGTALIKGDERECRIKANARTDNNTDFYLSLASAVSAKDNSFITFVNKEEEDVVAAFLANAQRADIQKQTKEQDTEQKKRDQLQTKVYLDLQIEATPAAEVSLLIDPRTGDRLKARGEGNLKLSYDLAANDIKLYGNYALLAGTFQFTFQNVIRKDFKLMEGSRVYFTGDPMNLQIDASAYYQTTASLQDLFGTEYDQVGAGRASVPVNCILYLKDNIMNPTISFGIELPQSDESTVTQVKSIISTEDMLMRQILYLLVFNRFYTPEYLQTDTRNVGLNESFSLISSTVTGQINNWLSQLTSGLSLGFNVRAEGLTAEDSQEYEAQFQYQYNNRLVINGNFGYRYNDISNQPLFGNLDVEFLLTPSGRWRAKAFTHMVDKYSLKESQTIQGVGFMFKYDFGGQDKKKIEKKKGKETATVTDTTTVIDVSPAAIVADTIE